MQDELFQITDCFADEKQGQSVARVLLNAGHRVFDGHFPGNPILPGVCTLQIIRSVLDQVMQGECRLEKASVIKFLGFVNPHADNNLLVKVETGQLEGNIVPVQAGVTAGDRTICTLRGHYLIS